MKKLELLAATPFSLAIFNAMIDCETADKDIIKLFDIDFNYHSLASVDVDIEVNIKVNGHELDISEYMEKYFNSIINEVDEILENKAKEQILDKLDELETVINTLRYNMEI